MSNVRELVSDVEMEATVLGAIMLDNSAMAKVRHILTSDCFHNPKNREIFEAITILHDSGAPIDLMTVNAELRTRKNRVSDLNLLMECTSKVASAANIEYHVSLLAEFSMRRACLPISTVCYNTSVDFVSPLSNVVDNITELLGKINALQSNKEPESLKDVAEKTILQMETNSRNKGGLSGITSGFKDIDAITSGWQKSDLIIVGARPAMGKSAFMVSLAIEMAKEGKKGAIFSPEMSAMQIGMRIMSYISNIDSSRIRTGKLSADEWKLIGTCLNQASKYGIHIDDSSTLSVEELRQKAIKLKSTVGLEYLMVDYLQIMKVGSKKGSREQEVSDIARGLKSLAKELDIPIIAFSQLSRGLEARTDKKPILSDLRESGSLEQESNVVMFLHRPEYYGMLVDANGESTEGLADAIIAKNRDGALGDVKLRFNGRCTKFSSMVKEEKVYTSYANFEKETEYETPF